MKKYILLAMLVFMAGTFFASCGGDDDNNDDITNNGGGGSDDEDFNTQSLIVGSWKMAWNSYENGVIVSSNYEILTFNSDGTGSNYYSENGFSGNDPIRYVYDSDKRTLTIFNERNGYKDIYKVKSISRTKLVIELNINNAYEEVYYRM